MSSQEPLKSWAAFMSGELDEPGESDLIQRLQSDEGLLSEALQDAELDSLLRALARSERPQDETRFVESVLAQLAPSSAAELDWTRDRMTPTGDVVPPPRELPPRSVPPAPVPAHRFSGSPTESPPITGATDEAAEHQHAGDDAAAVRAASAADPTSTNRRAWAMAAALAVATVIMLSLMVFQDLSSDAKYAESGKSPVIAPTESEPSRATLERDGSRGAGSAESQPLDSALHPQDPTAEPRAADGPPAERSDSNQDHPTRSAFAVLVASSPDAVWYQRPEKEQSGQSLGLQHGQAEFRFASGASVIVDGPAEFALDSENSMLVARGRVTAEVPAPAIGFTVDTPLTRIIDLGTKFKARVSDAGVAVQVMEGSVSLGLGSDRGNVIEASQSRFVEPSGTTVDWKVVVNADVFGDVSLTVNGRPLPVASFEDLEAIRDDSKSSIESVVMAREHDGFAATYIFNGTENHYDSSSARAGGARVVSDLRRLADLAARAARTAGSYQVNDRKYPFAGLKDKLEVRKKIARVHGSRALGGRFWENESFQTTAPDCESLVQLHFELATRLNYYDAETASPKRTDNRVPPHVGILATKADQDRPAARPRSPERRHAVIPPPTEVLNRIPSRGIHLRDGQSENRVSAFTQLEQMAQRKRRDRQAPPAAAQSSDTSPTDSSDSPSVPPPAVNDDSEAIDSQPVEDSQPAETDLSDAKVLPATPIDREDADQLVDAALRAELKGDPQQRQQFLTSVLREHPNHAPANWHLGNIKQGGRWLTLESAQAQSRKSPTLATYQRMRATRDGSVADDLELARWSKTRRPDLARVHYQRVFDHKQATVGARAEAARFLDLVPGPNGYLPRIEVERRKDVERRYRDAAGRWRLRLSQWVRWTRPQSKATEQQRAFDEMDAIDDPDIALVAAHFSRSGSHLFGDKLVDTVDRFPHAESSLCLAQIALDTPSPDVRQSAVIALQNRKWHDFVPELLGSLIGETKSAGKVERLLDGTVRFTHVFRHEGARNDQEQVTARDARPVIDLGNRTTTRLPGNSRELRRRIEQRRTDEGRRVAGQFLTELERRHQAARVANLRARNANERIYRAARRYHSRGACPTKRTHGGIGGRTTTPLTLRSRSSATWTMTTSRTPRSICHLASQRHSCFAAGTPIAIRDRHASCGRDPARRSRLRQTCGHRRIETAGRDGHHRTAGAGTARGVGNRWGNDPDDARAIRSGFHGRGLANGEVPPESVIKLHGLKRGVCGWTGLAGDPGLQRAVYNLVVDRVQQLLCGQRLLSWFTTTRSDAPPPSPSLGMPAQPRAVSSEFSALAKLRFSFPQ